MATHYRRWLHYWAILTVCATLPLLGLGAEVTTKQVGMVDREWPTAPWHLWLESWHERGLGFLIEHGHRLAGYIVGCCVIGLMAGLWLGQTRRWLSWLGVGALVGVSLQGVLGGLRVRLNAWWGPELALIHGCFGPLVFMLLVSLAVFTSRGWTEDAGTGPPAEARVRPWSLIVVVLVYLQLVLGAWLRHLGGGLSQRAHLLMACAVVAGVAWLGKLVLDSAGTDWRLRRAVQVLAAVVVVQLLLGVEAWMIRFSSLGLVYTQRYLAREDLVRTGHVLVGALTLAAAAVVALQARRLGVAGIQTSTEPVRRLEGAA